ncbi:unnamed protein product [Leptidea sinapis]|uniref:Peptidase S1 domain-containing protein n=1 Tax=Leptidea sinapis TaxID=189913 RepID=A0A5E4PR19_9NEOP|nr:unnamed protein product [Leptidea sinapis]
MDEVYVRTGATEYDDKNNALILAKSFKSHPNYTDTSHDNDIGVVQLTRKLDISGKKEKMIKLVDAGTKLPVGGKLTVSGWGVTSEDGRVSRHLKYVQIQIVSDADCRKVYKEEFTENMFCAGVPKGGKDACQVMQELTRTRRNKYEDAETFGKRLRELLDTLYSVGKHGDRSYYEEMVIEQYTNQLDIKR